MSDLVGNPEDRFSRDMAHIIQLKKVDPITIKLLVLITVSTMKSVFFGKVCWFVCLRLYVPVYNFSVILGRLPGFNQY